jgi:hypothetical protein
MPIRKMLPLFILILGPIAVGKPAQVPLFGRAHEQLSGTSAHTLDVAIGDLDADGDPDAFVTWLHETLLLPNDGSGNFGVERNWHDLSGGRYGLRALGDVDGDGDVDAFLSNFQTRIGANHLALDDGTGAFLDASANLQLSNGAPSSVSLADVDGDGDLDALFAAARQLCLCACPQTRISRAAPPRGTSTAMVPWTWWCPTRTRPRVCS